MANTPTVLVIEDDEQWQSVIKETLEDEGYNVIALSNYRQSRQALSDYVFDFVILDLELDESAPMLDGERLLRQLYQRRPDTPCVIVSGQGDVNVVRNAFKEYRVADFIPKDQFDIPNFVQTVQDALSQYQAAKDPLSVEKPTNVGDSAPPSKSAPTPEFKSQLLQILAERFSEEELRTLCFHLGVDDQKLGGKGKEAKARELIYYLVHRQSLSKLLEAGQRMRPDILWGDIS